MDHALTNAKPFVLINDRLHNTKTISTSGDLDGGTLALQFRNKNTDAWQTDATFALLADEHINGILTITAREHRLVCTGHTTLAASAVVG